MPDILFEVPINAPADQLYQALTEQSGLRSWWTQAANAQPTVGTVSEFSFYNGGVNLHLEVEQLEPNQRVVWKPVSGVPDWPGTRVTWDLIPTDTGTKLLFGHRNFASAEGSLPYSGYNWAWYIISLKKYVETGVGSPHTGDATT
ncbi:MAG: SRPBCC domain-containing protein [Chloroflexota bacterium]